MAVSVNPINKIALTIIFVFKSLLFFKTQHLVTSILLCRTMYSVTTNSTAPNAPFSDQKWSQYSNILISGKTSSARSPTDRQAPQWRKSPFFVCLPGSDGERFDQTVHSKLFVIFNNYSHRKIPLINCGKTSTTRVYICALYTLTKINSANKKYSWYIYLIVKYLFYILFVIFDKEFL